MKHLQTYILHLWLALPLAALAQEQAAPEQANLEGLQACAEMTDDLQRLACYDALAASDRANEAAGIASMETEPIPGLMDQPPSELLTTAGQGLARQRADVEVAIADLPWAVLPHYRNYLLPLSYNDEVNETDWAAQFPGVGLQDVEAKFQISIKALAVRNIFGKGTNLWTAYTQENWWQVYNSDLSSPFRETNYQPEVMLTVDKDLKVLGFTNTQWGLSFNHQSNGRSQLLSRSWNRIIASADFERNDKLLRLRAWYRLPESNSNDDNRDIEEYLGYGDATIVWRKGNQEFSVIARNNLRSRSDNRGALRLDWTFPMSRRFRGYVQYFYGYGESMIDYNVHTNRIGIGVTLTDLL